MKIRVNGQEVEVQPGMSVAAVVMNLGLAARRSVTGEARGPVCGMGVCFECRLWVDGKGPLRSCQMPVREGMEVVTDAA
jgi:predicted molibdopterin-dependent oxidoreductase YjgC